MVLIVHPQNIVHIIFIFSGISIVTIVLLLYDNLLVNIVYRLVSVSIPVDRCHILSMFNTIIYKFSWAIYSLYTNQFPIPNCEKNNILIESEK